MRKRILRWLFGKLLDLDFIGILRIKPGDALVIRSNERLTPETTAAIEMRFTEITRGQVSVVCLDARWNIEIIRNYDDKF
jgi:hypothetical protein